MPEWTAVILAGHRPGKDDFAEANGVSSKALIPVDGIPMLGRVAAALLAAESIGRVVVLAQEPAALLTGDLAWMAAEPRIELSRAGAGISASIGAIAGTSTAPFPLLVTTADHPLLSPDMVEAFIRGAAGADTAFAVVERATVEEQYPGIKRTWLKFREGHYTGANLFAFATPASRDAIAFWAKAETSRKKALRLFMFLGPVILIGALTRTISLKSAAATAGRKIRQELRAVPLPFANAAIDVDKPADLEIAEFVLAARQAGGV